MYESAITKHKYIKMYLNSLTVMYKETAANSVLLQFPVTLYWQKLLLNVKVREVKT